MKTIITDKITIGDVKKWIAKCNSLDSLQRIRAKTNKRIANITRKSSDSPFKNIPVSVKRKIMRPLLVYNGENKQ